MSAVRRGAVDELAKASLDESQLPLVEKAYAAETDPGLKSRLERMRSTMLVSSSDRGKRLAAAAELASSNQSAVASLLQERLAPGAESDAEVRAALQQSLASVRDRLAWGERLAVVFTGISLGSVLLLVALGLAITYGLMGVINMAHGELMMIGAYTTYVIQNLFRAYLPGAFDAYVLAAIPAAFLVSALVGAMLERGVIRLLYGRPLETLLATWGISLVLQQAVRSIFGAQNVPVENPNWLSGGVEVMSNLVLPFNRIAIIAFAVHRPRRRRAADRADALRPLHPRRHAEPAHGVVRRRRHREDRHAGVLVRRRHRRPRRRRALADRQRRPRPRPELHRRLVPGRRRSAASASSPAPSSPRSASASSTSCSKAGRARCWRRSRSSSSSSSSSRGSRQGCSR